MVKSKMPLSPFDFCFGLFKNYLLLSKVYFPTLYFHPDRLRNFTA